MYAIRSYYDHGGEPLDEAVRMAKILRRRRVTSIVLDTDRMIAGPAAPRASMEAGEMRKGSRGRNNFV